jgi:RNA polymerase sigma-70 factor (ECF subfamily)
LNEEQLIAAIKRNQALFGQVYDVHYNAIFNYCFRRTGDFDTSKDITSETFLKAFLNISKFKWRGISILSWLYRIATNEISLHYRAKKYRPACLSELGMDATLESNATHLQHEKSESEKELESHQQFIQVQKSILELPIIYQEVISLKYFEKMRIKEISDILDKPEGIVKSLLSRGIQQLKLKN